LDEVLNVFLEISTLEMLFQFTVCRWYWSSTPNLIQRTTGL